ncbi:MAG: DUF5683 domain-containing protein [Gracilimonas sp.]|nr:DUF5683 domain-containing protein [Gracilimonas sp.]
MRSVMVFILLALTFFLTTVCEAQYVSDFSNEIFADQKTNTQIEQRRDISKSSFVSSAAVFDIPRKNPGAAFLASAIIPGAGQAANKKWVRAGIYFTAEVVGLIYHLDKNAKARRQEQAYERFTHQNWSVVAYAEWLVNYSQIHGLDNNWQALEAQLSGVPDWNDTRNDWDQISLNVLHNVEASTPFYFKDRVGSNFSHLLPNYGSQQYYELISKYYQYQPGWRDWYNDVTTSPTQNVDMYRYFWNGTDEPFSLFYEGRDRAAEFNNNYRVAGNILKLIVVNHVVSAFDAFFTVQLKNSRIETQTNLMRLEQFSVTWHF